MKDAIPGLSLVEASSLERTIPLSAESHVPNGASRFERNAAVMFVDVTGSTRLYNALGDQRAHSLVNSCLRDVSNVVCQRGGRIVKSMGDGVMTVFDTADAAVQTSIDLQIHANTYPPDEYPISIHIGINWGPVLCEAGDVFGDTVNIAAFMCAQASRDQILVTSSVADSLSIELSSWTRPAYLTVLKGGQNESVVHQVLWSEDASDLTQPKLRHVTASGADAGALMLRCHGHGQEIRLDYRRRHVTLGRSASSDIVIEDHSVSRLHAVISAQQTQFCLVDQSINGTYIRLRSGTEIELSRGRHLLDSHGALSLGRSFSENASASLISFRRDRRSMYRP